ncbi:MAG: hypothetical protein Q8936_12545 [Bacillota bacterium]|nr:hypothetical protein [Bacillota bacterium]
MKSYDTLCCESYDELMDELKSKLKNNENERTNLYKNMRKNLLSYKSGIIEGWQWYKNNLTYNRRCSELDEEYNKLHTALYKLKQNQSY